jgi:hypothetical protein
MHSLGSARALVDQSYEEFVAQAPADLRAAARQLPRLLGLTSRDEVGWSDAVAEPVMLGLPTLLLKQIRRRVSPQLRASAQRAHLFAMISALIQERLDDRSLAVDDQIDALLLVIERHRHRALAELRLLGADRNSSFVTAEREARSASARELSIFAGQSEADIPKFVAICCGKQSLAFPATMAAVAAAGAELDEIGHVHDVILGVTLGLATRSEVVNRSELEDTGRSWVVALSRQRERSEVISELLDVAAGAFEKAAAAASALGAEELLGWAHQQAEQLRAQLRERGRASAA